MKVFVPSTDCLSRQGLVKSRGSLSYNIDVLGRLVYNEVYYEPKL